jgi:hypothetical protein
MSIAELENQWLLYEPSGMVLTFRSDGKFNHSMGNQPPTEEWFDIRDDSD